MHRFYTSAIAKHGISAQGVNWASKCNQELRFEALCKLLPKQLQDSTLVDAGCGFGDFYLYLEKCNNLPKSYIGIDTLYEMVQIASENTASEILHKDICKEDLPYAEFYLCSGALNVLTPFEVQLFVSNCYKHSQKGFIFNALEGKNESETYTYLTKEQIDKLAKALSVGEVVFLDGYLEDDITVGFFR